MSSEIIRIFGSVRIGLFYAGPPLMELIADDTLVYVGYPRPRASLHEGSYRGLLSRQWVWSELGSMTFGLCNVLIEDREGRFTRFSTLPWSHGKLERLLQRARHHDIEIGFTRWRPP